MINRLQLQVQRGMNTPSRKNTIKTLHITGIDPCISNTDFHFFVMEISIKFDYFFPLVVQNVQTNPSYVKITLSSNLKNAKTLMTFDIVSFINFSLFN